MKRGLFVLATLTLSSALYAQHTLTLEQARGIFAQYNPNLLERAAQSPQLNELVEQVLSSYVEQQPTDDLQNHYALAALARNFDNSIALNVVTDEYAQAVYYSKLGQDVQAQARAAAQQKLQAIFPRMWAVSVQTQEALLQQYKKQYVILKKDKTVDLQPLSQQIQTTENNLKSLKTKVGPNLQALIRSTLNSTEKQVEKQWQQLQAEQTSNLQIKTKHKKPVAK